MNPVNTNSPIAILQQKYLSLSNREKRLAWIMCVVVGLAAVVSWYQWQASANTKLDRSLPAARAQLAALQDASAEITRLRAQAKTPEVSTPQLIESLSAAASSLSLNLKIRQVEGGTIQVSGTGVDFDAWIVWAAQAQSTNTLRITAADIMPEANGVRLEAQLTQGH